jgi:catechol 2,3-dioxygenase-like lactoylglutathione lyase family enzyme
MLESPTPAPRESDVDVTAVHSLDHFALTVPTIDAGRDFYAGFGLTAEERANRLELAALDGAVGFLFEGPRRALHHLSFGIYAEDLPRFERILAREGVERIDPPRESASDGLWFRDPDGHAIELVVARRRSLAEKSLMRIAISDPGAPGAPEFDTEIRPARLGHCLLFTPDVARMVDFYQRVLGLRLSDRSADIIAFMHGPHGTDHHVLAFAKSSRPGFHHASFEVPSVDHIGLGAMHMAERGYRKGWGLGRHYIGSNFFHYIRDPWGSFAEYFCDIDYVPAGCTWPVREVDPRFGVHVWGPDIPPYFLENYEGIDPD